MKTNLLFLMSGLFLLFAAFGNAQAQIEQGPMVPQGFWGTVTFADGRPVPRGTPVSAFKDGDHCHSVSTGDQRGLRAHDYRMWYPDLCGEGTYQLVARVEVGGKTLWGSAFGVLTISGGHRVDIIVNSEIAPLKRGP